MRTLHPAYLLASMVLLAALVIANRRTAKRAGVPFADAIFRPSQVMLAYCLVFYFFGALFFWSSSILKEAYLIESQYWSAFPLVVWAAATAVAVILTNLGGTPQQTFGKIYLPNSFTASCAIIGLVLVIIHAATGYYPTIIMGFSFLLCAYGNSKHPPRWLIVISLLAFAISLPLASFSKRIVIFPALAIIILLYQRGSISVRSFCAFLFIAIAAIIPMSIMRGYGSFSPDNFVEAVGYSIDYVNNPLFRKFVANNLEFTSFYFHGINSVEIFSKLNLVLFGETILRAFISPLIYFGVVDGLGSSIEIYTQLYDPKFRAIGGSFPVNIFSEVFMNFGIFSIFVFGLVCKIVDALGSKASSSMFGFVRFSFAGSLLFCCLLLARGSSFSLFVYNLLFAIVPIGLAMLVVPLSARVARPNMHAI